MTVSVHIIPYIRACRLASLPFKLTLTSCPRHHTQLSTEYVCSCMRRVSHKYIDLQKTSSDSCHLRINIMTRKYVFGLCAPFLSLDFENFTFTFSTSILMKRQGKFMMFRKVREGSFISGYTLHSLFAPHKNHWSLWKKYDRLLLLKVIIISIIHGTLFNPGRIKYEQCKDKKTIL